MLRTLIAVLLLSTALFGFCPCPEPLVCGEYFRREVIFTGTVVEERWISEYGDPYAAREYRLKVQHNYKGAGEEVITVLVRNDANRFPSDLWKSYRGQSLLVFASPFRGSLWMDACSKSGFVSQSATAISELDNFSRGTRSGGQVSGEIAPFSASSKDDPAVRITVQSKSRPGAIYVTQADGKGKFSVFVPAGEYVVSAEKSGSRVSPSERSLDNPNALTIHDGQCGQVLFTISPLR